MNAFYFVFVLQKCHNYNRRSKVFHIWLLFTISYKQMLNYSTCSNGICFSLISSPLDFEFSPRCVLLSTKRWKWWMIHVNYAICRHFINFFESIDQFSKGNLLGPRNAWLCSSWFTFPWFLLKQNLWFWINFAFDLITFFKWKIWLFSILGNICWTLRATFGCFRRNAWLKASVKDSLL